jgi:hypothetical protein
VPPATVSAMLPTVDTADATVATALGLAGTLLESAMVLGKARFVRNIATYMQVRACRAAAACGPA